MCRLSVEIGRAEKTCESYGTSRSRSYIDEFKAAANVYYRPLDEENIQVLHRVLMRDEDHTKAYKEEIAALESRKVQQKEKLADTNLMLGVAAANRDTTAVLAF